MARWGARGFWGQEGSGPEEVTGEKRYGVYIGQFILKVKAPAGARIESENNEICEGMDFYIEPFDSVELTALIPEEDPEGPYSTVKASWTYGDDGLTMLHLSGIEGACPKVALKINEDGTIEFKAKSLKSYEGEEYMWVLEVDKRDNVLFMLVEVGEAEW